MRSYSDTCPIAAQAAQGAIALIRCSGQGVLELLERVFSRPRELHSAPGNTIIHGWIQDFSSGNPIDEVLLSVFRAPRSYTGEDGADISCHGGSAAVKSVLATLRKAGFKDALPGEFTFRSFMNGKIDLTRSESVMELVSARTKEGLEHAVRRLSGALEKEIKAIRDKLLETVSAAELFLDYPEDEIDTDTGTDTADLSGSLPYREKAEESLLQLKSLAATYRRERLYQDGALVVIAGRPNAGKSSLFNALLNEDRSIVNETPGTTRDWIEAPVSVKGIPLRLADTAGLRDIFLESNKIEEEGIRRSKELVEEADILLYTIDGCEGIVEADEKFLLDHAEKTFLLIWNKIDLKEPAEASFAKNNRPVIPVSAKTGKGLEELCASISSLLIKKTAEDTQADGDFISKSAGLGTERQKDLVQKAVLLLEEALIMADQNETLDLIAPILRETLNTLGEITGEVSSADILDMMFSRFCLGK